MASLVNTITGYFSSPDSPKLCGQHRDTFCFLSIRDRHPVTITKIIDQTFKLGCNNKELAQDTKDVTAKLSRLKSRLQTDKELEPIEGSGKDLEIWNNAIKQLQPNTWFSAPWLFIECYLYRVVQEAFQTTSHLTYPLYDTFREEKCKGLQDSLSNMSTIAQLLLRESSSSPPEKLLPEFIKLSLWGNKTDLSLLKHFNLELADVQNSDVDANDGMILCNHLEKVVGYLLGLEDAKVDIVLDNSGYELFGDLCLAEVLLRTSRVNTVTFHMKSIPWFVSDVTEFDMNFMIDTLKGSEDASLRELGTLWDSRFKDGCFVRTHHLFWTTPYGFSEMKSVSPDLYADLSKANFVFLKGDLNYRKLVNDRAWPYDTSFSTALEGFNPAPLCVLRTIKSDSIVGCKKEAVEKVLEGDKDPNSFCGAYALISSNLS